MYELDSSATHAVNAVSGFAPVPDAAMIRISAIRVLLTVLAVACRWWTGKNRHHTRHVLLAAGFSFLLGVGLNQIILLFVSRILPYDVEVTHLLVSRRADFSFPSDHATASFAIAAAFLVHRMTWRGVIFVAAATILAFSRVYIGTDYASDILGGAATGFLAAQIVGTVYREGPRIDRFAKGIL